MKTMNADGKRQPLVSTIIRKFIPHSTSPIPHSPFIVYRSSFILTHHEPFNTNDLIAYLDEALPADTMAAIEEALRRDSQAGGAADRNDCST